jgi:hypothetical protein
VSIIWRDSAALACSDILVLDTSGMFEQGHLRRLTHPAATSALPPAADIRLRRNNRRNGQLRKSWPANNEGNDGLKRCATGSLSYRKRATPGAKMSCRTEFHVPVKPARNSKSAVVMS